MGSKIVGGSEVRLNLLGAEISIAISVLGVVCVALASKFWILLAGKTLYCYYFVPVLATICKDTSSHTVNAVLFLSFFLFLHTFLIPLGF